MMSQIIPNGRPHLTIEKGLSQCPVGDCGASSTVHHQPRHQGAYLRAVLACRIRLVNPALASMDSWISSSEDLYWHRLIFHAASSWTAHL